MKSNVERLERVASALNEERLDIPHCTDNINHFLNLIVKQNELTSTTLLAILEVLSE